MRARSCVALAIALSGAVACTRPATVGSEDGLHAQEAAVTGTIRQTGSPPYVQTRIETESGAVVVTGPLALELARAAGARALVRGRRGSVEAGVPTIDGATYELLSIDGERPVVGLLLRDEGGWLVRAGDGSEVKLRAVPERLRCSAGAKIWVLTGEGGAVDRYGILREAEEEGG